MKKIKNWKSFNELNRSTLMSAAKEAEKIGDGKLAKRFRDHTNHENEVKQKSHINGQLKKYESLEPFHFVVYDGDKEYNFTGKFYGTDPGMEIDVFVNNGLTDVCIPTFFLMEGEDPTGKPFSGTFSPFWISDWDGRTTVSGPYSIDETPFANYPDNPGGFLDEGGHNPILFSSRKDANRFLNYLKNGEILKKQYEERYNRYYKGKEEPEEEWSEFMVAREELINNIRVRQLYRS